MEQKKQTYYIGFSFTHHGKHSGYDLISKYVNYDNYINCQKSYDLVNKLKKFYCIRKTYFKIFGAQLWWIDLRLILISIFNPGKSIFHYIYGENLYHNLGNFKNSNKIVLTLHQPPSFYDKKENEKFMKSIKKVDKLIVMSNEMEIYFKNKFPEKEISFIPHGIDCDYFAPKNDKENNIMMIGNWLRNFEFAAKVFSSIKVIQPNIHISVLTNVQNYSHFKNIDVELLNGISDRNYLQLLQKSKIVFLPLEKFAANNALLEACSCGNHVIISTDKKNIPEKNNTPIIFLENDINNIVDTIISLVKNWNNDTEIKNRDYVKHEYNWEKIGHLTEQFILK